MINLPKKWINDFKGKNLWKEIFALTGKVFREKDGRTTLRFLYDNESYFIKLHRGIGWKKIIKSFLQFRKPPPLSAENEWNAIKKLEKLNIKTMQLIGYGIRGRNPAKKESFLITKELINTESLETICKKWNKNPPSYSFKKKLILKVAGIARTIHEAGLNHRDFYICHFLLDLKSDEKYPILYLIDLHRVDFREKLPLRWRVKDIAGIYFSVMDINLTKRDIYRFIRAYIGLDLKTSIKSNKIFWFYVKKRALALYKKEFKRKAPVI